MTKGTGVNGDNGGYPLSALPYVEVKAAAEVTSIHKGPSLGYMKLLGLIINFHSFKLAKTCRDRCSQLPIETAAAEQTETTESFLC